MLSVLTALYQMAISLNPGAITACPIASTAVNFIYPPLQACTGRALFFAKTACLESPSHSHAGRLVTAAVLTVVAQHQSRVTAQRHLSLKTAHQRRVARQRGTCHGKAAAPFKRNDTVLTQLAPGMAHAQRCTHAGGFACCLVPLGCFAFFGVTVRLLPELLLEFDFLFPRPRHASLEARSPRASTRTDIL